MASHVPRVHLYRHAGFPLQENPGVPVLAPYGFNMGGGSDIMHLLHSRLASLPQAPPDAAEIFFAFLQPYRPPFHAWTEADHARIRGMGPEREDYMPNSFRLTLITMCEQIRNGTFIRALMPHLKRSTLRRHALNWHAGTIGTASIRDHLWAYKWMARIQIGVVLLSSISDDPGVLLGRLLRLWLWLRRWLRLLRRRQLRL